MLTHYKIISKILDNVLISLKLSEWMYNIVGKTYSKFDLLWSTWKKVAHISFIRNKLNSFNSLQNYFQNFWKSADLPETIRMNGIIVYKTYSKFDLILSTRKKVAHTFFIGNKQKSFLFIKSFLKSLKIDWSTWNFQNESIIL